MRSHNDSIDTTHTPPPLSFYNTYKERASSLVLLLFFLLSNPKIFSVSASLQPFSTLSFNTLQNQYRKFETNIPREGIAWPQSQFPHSPHSCASERFIYSHDRSVYSPAENMWTDPGNIKIAHIHMTVEIGTVAAHFPEKQYINRIFVAV